MSRDHPGSLFEFTNAENDDSHSSKNLLEDV